MMPNLISTFNRTLCAGVPNLYSAPPNIGALMKASKDALYVPILILLALELKLKSNILSETLKWILSKRYVKIKITSSYEYILLKKFSESYPNLKFYVRNSTNLVNIGNNEF